MSFLSWLYGDEENAQRAAEADAELRRMNRERYGVDYVNEDDWSNPAQQEQEISDAFDEGWDEGRENVQGAVGKTFGVVGDTFKAAFLGVPFWFWLVVLAGVWIWLGAPGLNKIRQRLK